MTLKPNHIQDETTSVGIRGECVVVLTHIPTRISVTAEVNPEGRFKTEDECKEFLLRRLTNEVMDFKVAEWHDAETDQAVYEYLGITYEQYAAWVEQREEENGE